MNLKKYYLILLVFSLGCDFDRKTKSGHQLKDGDKVRVIGGFYEGREEKIIGYRKGYKYSIELSNISRYQNPRNLELLNVPREEQKESTLHEYPAEPFLVFLIICGAFIYKWLKLPPIAYFTIILFCFSFILMRTFNWLSLSFLLIFIYLDINKDIILEKINNYIKEKYDIKQNN